MKILIRVILGVFLLCAVSGCKLIINKMAFHPDTVHVLPIDQLPAGVREVFIETDDHIELQCYYLSRKRSDYILIYFHGNAGNISHRLSDLMRIRSFGINVLGVGYRGYGKSQGAPSEQGVYRDGLAALNYAQQQLGFSSDRIIIMGRSIGSTVAMNTSQNRKIGGIILVTPLTSGKDMAKATGLGFLSPLAGNAFNNLAKAGKIEVPALVIHGTKDEVIPFEMGKKIFEHLNTEKRFVQIDGGSHNDLSTRFESGYWPPIYQFINDIMKSGA